MTAVPPAVRKVSEKAFQRAVIDLAQTLGWGVAHFHDSRRQVRPGVHVGDRSAAGFPGLVMIRHGRLLFVELKAEKGKLRPTQEHWIEALREAESDCAGRVLVRVWRPSDWDSGEIATVLARRIA